MAFEESSFQTYVFLMKGYGHPRSAEKVRDEKGGMRFRLRANLSERRGEKQASAIARELIPAPTPEPVGGRWRNVFLAMLE